MVDCLSVWMNESMNGWLDRKLLIAIIIFHLTAYFYISQAYSLSLSFSLSLFDWVEKLIPTWKEKYYENERKSDRKKTKNKKRPSRFGHTQSTCLIFEQKIEIIE